MHTSKVTHVITNLQFQDQKQIDSLDSFVSIPEPCIHVESYVGILIAQFPGFRAKSKYKNLKLHLENQ